MRAFARSGVLPCALSTISALFGLTFALPALAQIPAPPRHDTLSGTGVSYRDGAFNWNEQDLSIGGDDGLTFGRTYISSSADGFSPGWLYSTVSTIRVSPVPLDPELTPPPPQFTKWVYHVVIGGRSYAFIGGLKDVSTGAPKRGGTFQPVEDNGTALVYTGTSSSGYFTLTDSDGSVITFDNWVTGQVSSWIKPDGTRLDYAYGATTVVTSNRGYALIVEGKAKACAVNLASTYVSLTAGSTCPGDAQTVIYGYSAAPAAPFNQVLTSASKAGATTTYEYVGANHLGCIKEPGQTVCRISTQYGFCPEDPSDPSVRYSRHYRDPVISQQTATGETFSYSYAGGGYLNLCDYTNEYTNSANVYTLSDGNTLMTTNTGARTQVRTTIGGLPYYVKDPLNRETSAEYTGNGLLDTAISKLLWRSEAEGNKAEYAYDTRGNITSKTVKAKPGSGLADLVTSAAYPATCSNTKTCNKPTSVTDPRSNTISYTYDAMHGGVLTETAPADPSGIQAVKRYAYLQRYAWIKNAGGGFSQASSPVWLLSEERSCRSTATVGNACAGGAGDEVIVSYDYGPNTGAVGNNLQLRGKTVTAQDSDGVIRSLRTCYGYDREGNKIWETSARAALAACY